MKNITTLLAGSAALATIAFANPAEAVVFNFSCDPAINSTDCAGNEGGTLEFLSTALGNGTYEYTMNINNTSPSALVTGFGFDFGSGFNFSSITSTSAKRLASNGTTYENVNWNFTPGTSSVSSGSSYGSSGNNLTIIDFDADQQGNVNANAVFNRSTTNFDGIFKFTSTQNLTASAGLLRFQSTGTNGNGSLKLLNTTPPESVPEPMGLLGMVGVGLGVAMRRRK